MISSSGFDATIVEAIDSGASFGSSFSIINSSGGFPPPIQSSSFSSSSGGLGAASFSGLSFRRTSKSLLTAISL